MNSDLLHAAQALPEQRGGTQRATVSVLSLTGDETDRVVALSYSCDFKAEEEYGVGALRTAFASAGVLLPFMDGPAKPRGFTPHQHDLVHRTEDAMFFATASYHLASVQRARKGLVHVDEAARGQASRRFALEATTMAELRTMAPPGVTVPRRKNDLVALLLDIETERQEDSGVYGGWFQNGQTLALPRRGVMGLMLDHLWEAAQRGTLLVGSAGNVAFGSGLTILDAEDLTERAQEMILEINLIYAQRMADLEPVAAHLKAEGHRWFFLGKPTVLGDGQVHYWLNGYGGPEGQPFGWYTLEELRAEKFLDDLRERNAEKRR